MGKRLGEGVNVILTDPKTHEPVTFMGGRVDNYGNEVRGDELPAWAEKLCGPHCFEGYDPDAEVEEPDEGPTPPPMGGQGSSADAWREYAGEVGVTDIAPDASRDQIVDAIKAAGKPVE